MRLHRLQVTCFRQVCFICELTHLNDSHYTACFRSWQVLETDTHCLASYLLAQHVSSFALHSLSIRTDLAPFSFQPICTCKLAHVLATGSKNGDSAQQSSRTSMRYPHCILNRGHPALHGKLGSGLHRLFHDGNCGQGCIPASIFF